MNVQEARELNKNIAKQTMEMIFLDIRKAAESGALKIDLGVPDEIEDLYDYIIIPELEKMGYNVNTFNSSSSEINGGELYRTLRICWHPRP